MIIHSPSMWFHILLPILCIFQVILRFSFSVMNSLKIFIYFHYESIHISIAMIPISSRFKKTIRQHFYGILIMLSLIPLIKILIHLFFILCHALNFWGPISIQKTFNFPSISTHSKVIDHSLFVAISWLYHLSYPFYEWVPSVVAPTLLLIPLIILFIFGISYFPNLVPD